MNCDPRLLPNRRGGFGDYDPSDDMRRSLEFAYAFIRQRAARGGRGWPVSVALEPNGIPRPRAEATLIALYGARR
jgi:hypothetical protein